MPNFTDRVLSESETAVWQGLKDESSDAIERVWRHTDRAARVIGREKGLSDEDFLELRTDAMMLLIRKIQAGAFVPNSAKITTYYVEIFKRVVLNAARKLERLKKIDVLDEMHLHFEDDATYITDSARIDKIMACLGALSAACQQLIRLRYFEEVSDDEIIKNKLTEHTTSDSLRNRRSQCLKKLRALCLDVTHHK